MNHLLRALGDMHSLSDFRLLLPHVYKLHSRVKTLNSLNKILWSVYELGIFDLLKTNCWYHSNDLLRLQTLYCNESLNLSRIIRSQTELQILGIYKYCDEYHAHEFEFLGILKRLQIAQIHLPVVVMFEYSEFFEDFYEISIFPAFYSIDCHPTIHQAQAS